MAFSALLSCDTPTTALRMRIVRILQLNSQLPIFLSLRVLHTTAGSTNAVQPSPSSNKAKTKDTAAEPRRIRTSWSLNCSRMSSHSGVGGSSGRARCMSVNSALAGYSCWITHHWDRTAFFALPLPLLKDLCSPRPGSASGHPAPGVRKHHPLRLLLFLRARCQGEIEVEALYR